MEGRTVLLIFLGIPLFMGLVFNGYCIGGMISSLIEDFKNKSK